MAAKPAAKPKAGADQAAAERVAVITTNPVRYDGEDLAPGTPLELERRAAEALVASGAAEFAAAPEIRP